MQTTFEAAGDAYERLRLALLNIHLLLDSTITAIEMVKEDLAKDVPVLTGVDLDTARRLLQEIATMLERSKQLIPIQKSLVAQAARHLGRVSGVWSTGMFASTVSRRAHPLMGYGQDGRKNLR